MATIRPDNSKVIKTKIVNINARIPVKNVAPPIYGVKNGIEMSISDILKCLTRRAIIHQVLSDGSLIQLTTKNFRDDFEGELQKKLKLAKMQNKNKITEPTIVTPEPDVEPINEVHIEDKPEPTGNIDDLNIIDDIDDDDDIDNNEEPEEAANVIITRKYIDGSVIESIGVEPKFQEPADEDEISEAEAAEEKPEEAVPAEEVTESEETETNEEPVVSDEVPVSSSTKKKNNNSKKSGSKKK